MLTRTDAARIADAITGLRGEWNQAQLIAVMGDERIRSHRQPQDVAAALAWCALDPDTRQPTRILGPGPWWGTTKPARRQTAYRAISGTDCAICFRPAATHPLTDDHDYEPQHRRRQSTRLTDEQRANLTTRTPTEETP